jgi:hypothetical protein
VTQPSLRWCLSGIVAVVGALYLGWHIGYNGGYYDATSWYIKNAPEVARVRALIASEPPDPDHTVYVFGPGIKLMIGGDGSCPDKTRPRKVIANDDYSKIFCSSGIYIITKSDLEKAAAVQGEKP